MGLTTFRMPYTPVTFGSLAGLSRGDLFDPVRTTPDARLGAVATSGFRERRSVEARSLFPAIRQKAWTKLWPAGVPRRAR